MWKHLQSESFHYYTFTALLMATVGSFAYFWDDLLAPTSARKRRFQHRAHSHSAASTVRFCKLEAWFKRIDVSVQSCSRTGACLPTSHLATCQSSSSRISSEGRWCKGSLVHAHPEHDQVRHFGPAPAARGVLPRHARHPWPQLHQQL